MIAVANDDLRPFTESAYAWRWQDPKYDVLPDAVLSSVQAIRPARARTLAMHLHDLHLWALDLPGGTIDTAEVPENEVSLALVSIDSDLAQPVVASWGHDDAILLPWSNFARYWSAFCYPSSDDVTVVPLSEPWALSYAHHEKFFWRRR